MDNGVEGEVMGFFDFVELQVTMLFYLSYFRQQSALRSGCANPGQDEYMYILGDEDLHYSDTNETAHLIKVQYIQTYSESHIDTENTSETWKAFLRTE